LNSRAHTFFEPEVVDGLGFLVGVGLVGDEGRLDLLEGEEASELVEDGLHVFLINSHSG